MQQPGHMASLPGKTPTSGRNAKIITGCGGCGCLVSLLAIVVGGGLLAWGLTDRKVDELVAPSAGILALAVLIGFMALALTIGGIIAMRRAGNQ